MYLITIIKIKSFFFNFLISTIESNYIKCSISKDPKILLIYDQITIDILAVTKNLNIKNKNKNKKNTVALSTLYEHDFFLKWMWKEVRIF